MEGTAMQAENEVIEVEITPENWTHAFAEAMKEGDADRIEGIGEFLRGGEADPGRTWPLIMEQIARLGSVPRESQDAFADVWKQSKGLSRHVEDRELTARGLRVIFADTYTGAALLLFRGANKGEGAAGTYGFSWSTKRETAMEFAKAQADAHKRLLESGSDYGEHFHGALFETAAPAEAILYVRQNTGDSYDEDEVIVDPFRLGEVRLVEF